MSRPSGAALVLSVLTLLFFARVAGQALVAAFGVAWLPPMETWFSGLLPYSILLPAQIAILVIQVAVNWAVWRNGGFAARPRAGRWLRGFAYAYALAMGARYAITRSHLLPITFHFVLAAYIFTIARLMSPVSWGPVPHLAEQQCPRRVGPGV